MIKISSIYIKRFRSIMEMTIDINTNNNFVTFCGQNNTGKTNTLRAIDVFFNPHRYIPREDAPSHKYSGSGGGAVYPEIVMHLFDDSNNTTYEITKKFDQDGLKSCNGIKYNDIKRRNIISLNTEDIANLHNRIKLYFVESANVHIPILINDLIEDLFDIEYEGARFTGLKNDLKKAFENYTTGLMTILKKLSDEIDPMFKEFHDNWGVSFTFDKDVKYFRDLISDEVVFSIIDGSKNEIDSKGAGLQRLAFLLLHLKIIEKIKNKSVIFLIDEPDLYLHAGLQKKLLNYIKDVSTRPQIFVTSHSKVFIDTYHLDNVFLLDLDISEKYYTRKHKSFKILSTKKVILNDFNGAKKIKQYLGIDEKDFDLLEKFNLLVEGECDKKYFLQLMNYFGMETPNIITSNGADNTIKFLEFYDSFYKNFGQYKPFINVLFDNDAKGRDIYQKVKNKKFSSITVAFSFTPNFLGETPDLEIIQKCKVNNEVEDFLYPELLCFLVNELLKKKGMHTISTKKVCANIQKPAFKNSGILTLCENSKNENNPEIGNEISFIGSDNYSNQVKNGLANIFNIEGNLNIINLIKESDLKYPKVREFVEKINKVNI